MSKYQSLSDRMYFDPVYTEMVRIIGYAGCEYRELWDKLQPLVEQFGKPRAETAVTHLLTFDGQVGGNPKPLAQVMLRSEARKHAWQLLGPAPDHPWFELWKKPERLPESWDPPPGAAPAKEGQKPEKPKRQRKKKAS